MSKLPTFALALLLAAGCMTCMSGGAAAQSLNQDFDAALMLRRIEMMKALRARMHAAETQHAKPPAKSAAGQYCREFQQSIDIGGRNQPAYGTACQQPDGSWTIVPTPSRGARSS
jgi:hypothetical protein